MAFIWNPSTLEKGLRADFVIASQAKRDPLLDSLMLNVPSTHDKEKYGWLGQIDDLREWKDSKTFVDTTEHSFEVKNVQYEGTIGVRRTDIEDDQVGAVSQRIKDLTTKGVFHPQRLLADAITGGAAALCYDGQYFFDTDHSEGASGTQVNVAASLGSGTTTAGAQADFRRARAAILSFKDSKGKPLFETGAVVKWLVVAPVGLLGIFEELQQAAILSQTTNVLKGAFDLVTLPRLTTVDVNDWYLFAYNDMMKPFILQQRDPLSFHAMEDQSDLGFTDNVFAYSVHWRGAVGYGWWQLGYKTTN